MVFDIGTFLLQWQSAGIFDYVLPFLLVFALIFALLSKSKVIGDYKGINIVIAIVIGLLALQLDFVPALFRELFPRLGVGVAVLLTLLILTGMFLPLTTGKSKDTWNYILAAIGFIIFIIILVQSFDRFGFYFNYSQDLVGWIVGAVLLIGIIIAVAASVKSRDEGTTETTGKSI